MTNEEDLQEQLYTLDNEALGCIAGSKLGDADTVLGKYQVDRKSGKSFRSKFQNFFTSLSEFLRAYSGIIEFVKDAGQVYGDVAYETCHFFFIVSLIIAIEASSVLTC
jgi:hypothetical protein